MRKIGAILLIEFTLRLIVSCCTCMDTTRHKYSYDQMETIHIDNSGPASDFVDNGIIPKKAYGIRLTLSLSLVVSSDSFGMSGFNTMYAISCGCPPENEYVAQDTIVSIRIRTLNDFDNTHLQNADVSDYFGILSSQYITIRDFINIPKRVYYTEPYKEDIELYLMQPPTFVGTHRFEVRLSLSNGRTLTSLTTEINLK